MGFTAAQAARLTGCSLSQLSSWERLGLVVPPPGRTHPYTFQDLVALRVVASLLDAGLSLARIRRAVQYLVESGEDVAALSLVTDGDTVWACRDDGQILDALRHGQLALFVGLDRVTEDVAAEVRAFDAERQEFVDGLRDGELDVTEPPPTGEAASGRAGGASARGRSRRRATPN
ncbi:MAG TPA: MerR family transcriptional regulator [Acidimicrobiia bacterium]|nr:MerR family transcriptional regulator [Acidimicrobiia bacterium]